MKFYFPAMFFTRLRSLMFALSLASAFGCSGSDQNPAASLVGGASSASGGTASAGAAATSGGAAVGGAAVGLGGSVTTSGGDVATNGGSANAGGDVATNGGSANLGGAPPTSGGSANTGGDVATNGGSANTGGDVATNGGSVNTGGDVATSGGSANTGGDVATSGGAPPSSGGSANLGGGTGGSPGDTVPPTVTALSPTPGASAIALDSTFQITFSEPILPSSVKEATFPLTAGSYIVPTSVSLSAPDRVTIAPLTPLPGGTSLTLQVATAVQDLAGNGLTLPATFLFTTATDTIAPVVVATSPANGFAGAPRTGPIQITFSEPLDPGTLVPANFSVVEGSVIVTPQITYQASAALVLLTAPTAEPLTTVTVTVGVGVKDAAGLPMAQPFSWSYTTEADTSAPTVISTNPTNGSNGISIDAPVILVFSEPMDPASFVDAVTLDGAVVTAVYDVTTHGISIQHAPLTAGSEHTVSVSSAVRDAYGNASGTLFTFSFNTAQDTTSPSVVSSIPALGASFVGTAFSPMTVTFSEDMDPATLSPTVAHIIGVAGTTSYDTATHTVAIVPSSTLVAGTAYTLEVVGAHDMGGNVLPTYQVPFRTPRSPVKLNTTSANGIVGLPSVAFNSSGVGVAVWTIQTGGGFSASYAIYSGGVWGAEQPLAACPNQAGTGYASVGTDGTTFLVGNSACDSSYTLRTVSASGAVGASITGPSLSAPYAVQILGSPAGFLITADSYFFVFAGGALSGGNQYCGAGAQGAASGNTFMVVCGGGMIQTGLVGYRWASGTWSGSTTLFSTNQTSGLSTRLAGGPLGYVLAWTFTDTATVPSTSNAYQRTFTGTGPWSAQTVIENLGSQKELVLAMANDHAVVAYNDGKATPNVRFASWNGTMWTAPASLSATSSSPSNAVASGNAMAITWGGLTTRVQANVNAGWGTAASFNFNSSFTGNNAGSFAAPTTNGGFPAVMFYNATNDTWSAPSNVGNVTGSSPLLRLTGANLAAVTYDASGIRAATAAWGASLGTPAALSFTPHRVGGLMPHILRSGSRVAAVWVEYAGTQLASCQLDAAVFDGTSWSAPTVLGSSLCTESAGIRLSRTSGDGVLVSWIDSSSCRVRGYTSAGGWMASTGTVGTATACAVAMDGSNWVAAWQSGTSILTATSTDGLTWSTPTTFANLSSPKLVVSGANRVIFAGTSTNVTAEHFVGSLYAARSAISASGGTWDAAGDGLGAFGVIKAGTVAFYDPVATVWGNPSTLAFSSANTSLLSALPGGGWLAASLGAYTGNYALRSNTGIWSTAMNLTLGTRQVLVTPGSTPFMLVQTSSSIMGSDLSGTGQLGPYGNIDSSGPFVGVDASTDTSGNISAIWGRYNGDAAYDTYAAANL